MPHTPKMTRKQLLDLYFMDARFKLVEIAAFLDRLDRAEGFGEEDFRLASFRRALSKLGDSRADRAGQVLVEFSDPTSEPIETATTQAACGAWPGKP